VPDTYRALVAQPSARRLLAALAVAWVSFGGVSLAVLLAVRRSTGSYAAAGAAAAGFSLGSALVAPARGRLVDRRGGRVLPALAGAYGVALALLALLARATTPAWALVAVATAAGASAPPLVASARGAWSTIVEGALLRRAYAATAAVGDAALVGAPAVAGLLCAWTPVAALAVCAVAAPAAALVEARFVGAGGSGGAGDGRSRLSGGFTVLLAVSVALGASLGLVEVAIPAKATGWHHAPLAGVLLGCFALGSIAGGLLAGRLAGAAPPLRRYLVAVLGIAVALVPPVTASGPLALGLLLVLCGLGYGPATVALFECLDGETGVGATEALTWVTTAEAVGSAAGAAAGGLLVTHVASGAPFPVAVAALALPAVAALLISRPADPARGANGHV
jgi:MFS family permease